MQICFNEIAVVENETGVREAIRRWLSLHGYAVTLFESAEQYLAANGAVSGCVLADMDLGSGMSGVELASCIAASRPGAAVILMSGSTDSELARRAMKVGCRAFLEKPFTGRQLLACLTRIRGAIASLCHCSGCASGNIHLPERISARGR